MELKALGKKLNEAIADRMLEKLRIHVKEGLVLV